MGSEWSSGIQMIRRTIGRVRIPPDSTNKFVARPRAGRQQIASRTLRAYNQPLRDVPAFPCIRWAVNAGKIKRP